jgi:hypothetical protein
MKRTLVAKQLPEATAWYVILLEMVTKFFTCIKPEASRVYS